MVKARKAFPLRAFDSTCIAASRGTGTEHRVTGFQVPPNGAAGFVFGMSSV